MKKPIDKEYLKKNLMTSFDKFKTIVLDKTYVKIEKDKTLSSFDFTKEYKDKLDEIIENGGTVIDTPVVPTTTPEYDKSEYPSYAIINSNKDIYYMVLSSPAKSTVYFGKNATNMILSNDSVLNLQLYKYNKSTNGWDLYYQNTDGYSNLCYVSLPNKDNIDFNVTETDLTIIDERTSFTPTDSSNVLDMEASVVCKDMGVGINLGCSFESFNQDDNSIKTVPTAYTLDNKYANTPNLANDNSCYETLWGNPHITYSMIKAIKDKGFKTMRLPISWGIHTNEYGKIDSRWLSRIKEVVNMILSLDMYCIINVHHDAHFGWLTADTDTYDTVSPIFRGIWYQVANEFKDYGGKLLFEGFNEILDLDNHWDNPSEADANICDQLNQDFVTTVRQTGGFNSKRHLIVSVLGTSATISNIGYFDVPTDIIDKHIIAQVHIYDDYVIKLPRAYELLSEKNVPIVLGEFGSDGKTDREIRKESLSQVVAYCKKYGIVPIYWDDGCGQEYTSETITNFCLFNRHKLTWLFDDIADSMINTWNNTTDDDEVKIDKIHKNTKAIYDDIQDIPCLFDGIDVDANNYKTVILLQSDKSYSTYEKFLALTTSTYLNVAPDKDNNFSFTFADDAEFKVYKSVDDYNWTEVPSSIFTTTKIKVENYNVAYNGTSLAFKYPSLITINNTYANDVFNYAKIYLSCDTLENITFGTDNGYVTVKSTEKINFVATTLSSQGWQEYTRIDNVDNLTTPLRFDYTKLVSKKDKYLSYNLSPTYKTMAELKADSKLKVGDVVTTGGYYNFDDGGAGNYVISNTNYPYATKSGWTTLTDNYFDSIALDNGLYANLIIKDRNRFPLILGGIQPYNENLVVSKKIQCMTYRMNLLGLQHFPTYLKEGTYWLDGVTALFGVNMVGHKGKAEIIIDGKHYKTHEGTDYFIKTPQVPDRKIDGKNLINIDRFWINGVNFTTLLSTESYQYSIAQSKADNRFETYMLCADNVEDVKVSNCTIVTKKAETDGWYTPCTPFEVRGKSKNVEIHDNEISNYTCDTDDKFSKVMETKENDTSNGGHENFTQSGALWFIHPGIDNLSVYNCNLNGTCSDEILSLFGTATVDKYSQEDKDKLGKYNYITKGVIKDCTLGATKHQSDEFIAVNYLRNSDILVTKCTFNVNVSTANPFKVANNFNTTVKLTDSTFNLNTNSSSIWNYNSTGELNNAMLFFKKDNDIALKDSNDTLTPEYANNTYEVDGCTFIGQETTKYRYFVNAVNTEVTVKNCTVTGGLHGDCGLGSFETNGCKINYIGNTFNSSATNKVIKIDKGAYRKQEFNLDDNTFNGTMYKFIVSNTNTSPNFAFNVTNNKFTFSNFADSNHYAVQTSASNLGDLLNEKGCTITESGNTYVQTLDGFINPTVASFLANTGKVPTYLQACENISTNAHSYFDTEFTGTNQDTKIECMYKSKNPTDTSAGAAGGFVYGTRTNDGGTTECFLLYDNKTNYSARMSDQVHANYTINKSFTSAGEETKVIQDKNGINMYFKDGTSIEKTWSISDFTCTKNFFISACNNGGTAPDGRAWYIWYYFKIWDNGKLVRDLIPAYNPTLNKACLYDRITGKSFYDMASNGKLSYELEQTA